MRIGSHLLVGYQPNSRGRDALAVAAAVLRISKGAISVAVVRPPVLEAAVHGSAHSTWEAYLDAQARMVLDQAVETLAEVGLPGNTKIDYIVTTNRSSGRGLARLVGKTRADLIVIGSAPGGAGGRVAVGSTADQLLHGSPVPVLLAPADHAEYGAEDVDRITIAYVRRPGAMVAVEFAARVAAVCDVPLRLLTVAVSDVAAAKSAGPSAEYQRRAVDIYAADLAVAAREAAKRGSLSAARVGVEIAQGPDVATAVGMTHWSSGELLVCSSGDAGPLHRVFVGDMSLKILRAVPCPVLVLPRITR